jgi:hypothetical protein
VEHPLSKQNPELGPVDMSGVLMVASLDGGLRLFQLASYRPSTPVLSRQPQEVPAEAPTWIRHAVAAAKRVSDEEVRHAVGDHQARCCRRRHSVYLSQCTCCSSSTGTCCQAMHADAVSCKP